MAAAEPGDPAEADLPVDASEDVEVADPALPSVHARQALMRDLRYLDDF